VDYPAPCVHTDQLPDSLCDVATVRSLFILRVADHEKRRVARMAINVQFICVGYRNIGCTDSEIEN
jgi:hypothetical protein